MPVCWYEGLVMKADSEAAIASIGLDPTMPCQQHVILHSLVEDFDTLIPSLLT